MDEQRTASGTTVAPADRPAEGAEPTERRSSRRSLLAALVGGVAGALAGSLARPQPTQAAAGDPLIIGSETNNAGTANTKLQTNSSGTAFYVQQNGSGTAIRANAVGSGSIGAHFTAANGPGISGVTASPGTFGVYGANDATTFGNGSAVRAAGKQNHGVNATTSNTSAYAVRAIHQATGTGPAYAIFGQIATTNGAAVFGESTDTSSNGTGRGVQGSASGGGLIVFFFPAPSAGVFGAHTATGSTTVAAGVWGEAFSADAAAVRALNWKTTGDAYGVLASTLSSAGYAGKFVGNVDVTGTLSKGGGSFKIDHPLDPTNKWLQHSFVESPDMMNIYNGNVTTDANGEATVELPAWFGALNRDYRYQLTTIGGPAQAWIASEIANNRFVIKTDQPNVKVSWQVTGIRQDAWANANRIQVEVPKTGQEKGKYAYPEAHGKPASMGIDYERSGRAAVDRYGLKKILEMRQTSGRPSA